MSDLVQLEQQLFAHDIQSTDFSGIFLLGEEDLTIATLSDLCEDLKVALPKTYSTLSQIGSLSTNVFGPDWIISFFGSGRRIGEFGFEMSKTILASTDVGQEIKVVI